MSTKGYYYLIWVICVIVEVIVYEVYDDTSLIIIIITPNYNAKGL